MDGSAMLRRDFLNTAGAALAVTPFLGTVRVHKALAASPGGQIDMSAQSGIMRFAVDRGGSDMGTHVLRFERLRRDRLKVAIDIDLVVKFGPIAVFRYTHRNRTIWENGRIYRLATNTDDDGERFRVEARRRDDGALDIISDDAETPTVAPGDILPSTYWLANTPKQSQLLNTQKGNIADVDVTDLAPRLQKTPQGDVTAHGYDMNGDIAAKVWYDPAGRWVGLNFDGKGETVSYTLVERSGYVPTAAPTGGDAT